MMKIFTKSLCILSKNIVSILTILLILRYIVGIVYSFYPVHTIHQWRQTDGLSVAMRYWLKWTIEGNYNWKMWLPAVLNSGHSSGIVAMEFPIINLLSAPFFYFGNYWGRVFAGIFLHSLNFGLLWLNYRLWKRAYISGVSIGVAVLLLPNFSFLTEYAVVFIPDFTAFMLVLLGVGLSYKIPKIFSSALFVALGVLIKPPSVVVLALLFFSPNVNKDLFKNHKTSNWIICCCISIALALTAVFIYYVPVLQYIIHNLQSMGHFNVELHRITANLIEFWQPLEKWYYLFTEHLFSQQSFILVVITLLWLRYKYYLSIIWTTWAVLALQIFTITALDGFHLYQHSYYFECVSLIPAIIFIFAWQNTRNKLMCSLFPITLILNFIAVVPNELFVTNSYHVVYPQECNQIINRNPNIPWKQSSIFQADSQEINEYPAIGLCFGERIGKESANYGLYQKDEIIPENCKIIDSTANTRLVKCSISNKLD